MLCQNKGTTKQNDLVNIFNNVNFHISGLIIDTVVILALLSAVTTISTAAFTCPPDPGPIFVADPEDCTKFYLCISGSPTQFSCPDGTHFSPSTLECLLPEEAGCVVTTQEPPEPTTPGLCPPEGIISFPHPTDCTKFYVCTNGDAILLDCPPGQHFSPTELICLPPDEAGCENAITTTTAGTTTSLPSDICPPTGTTFVPHPTDCTLYYFCMSGVATLMQCPQEQHFSPSELTCMTPEEAGCEPPTIECPPTGSSLVPHPSDCTLFYMCMSGEANLLSCPSGEHFSPTELKCLPPAAAGCEVFSFLTYSFHYDDINDWE